MSTLEGQVALVTGAGLGQGRSHAEYLARAGAAVALVDVCRPEPVAVHPTATPDDLARTVELVTAAGADTLAIEADVADDVAMDQVVAATIERWGRLDVVVANAGIFTIGTAWELSRETWDRMISVNLTGAWSTVRAAAPRMIEAGNGGSIVTIGSTGATKGVPNAAAYVAAKHGLVGLTKVLAHELGPHGIRVNMVCPTATDTTMLRNDVTRRLFTGGVDDEAAFADVSRRNHLLDMPWLEVDDVSEAVMFFATDASRRCTGSILHVDGGYTTR